MSQKITRKLTTILAADAEGFSAAMTRDELGTFSALHAARDVFYKLIERHDGRIANTAGDGLIAEFPSVVEAVQCAIETQRELATQQDGLRFRVGIHLGDVIVDGQDLIGEGVNLAARLQTMAQPGGILISQQVYDQVHAKLSTRFEYLGEKRPRNLPDDVAVYRVETGAAIDDDTPIWQDPVQVAPRADRPKTKPKPQPNPASEPAAETPATDATTDLSKALRLGALIAGGLVLINIFSGGAIWAHWALLPLAMAAGVKLAPVWLGRDTIGGINVRALVLIAGLILINLFSWSGHFWAIWPAGALIAAALGHKILSSDAD
ncbi:adenylate/guanylate cyclase domain-containing protein [Shimia sp. Alg240-R146]|uniref:adenylate/guanylate cyclase domain-containing protein n=1 Tax=Shimia sp. Alg240-R146 TaxID=2993449 RepID=UPI0022E5A064|nr:adenylate/guanylate cyclase domain-containing protein [Shimia sp. Alg240-R146]